MKKRRLIGMLMLLIMIAGAAWLGRDSQVPGLQLTPLYWLVSGDLTNDAATQTMRDGVELFIAERNQQGGYQGHPLKLMQVDDSSETAPTLASRLQRVLAAITQPQTASAADFFRQAQIPALAPLSTLPLGDDWVFPLNNSEAQYSTLLANYIHAVLEHQQVVLWSDEDSFARSFSAAAQQLGLTVQRCNTEAATLAALRNTPAAALMLAVSAAPAKALLRSVREQNLSPTIVAANALATVDFLRSFGDLPAEQRQAGFYTDGVYFPLPLTADSASIPVRALLDTAQHDNLRSTPWPLLAGYDAAALLFQALQGFDAADLPLAQSRALIRDNLASSAANFIGLSGKQPMMAEAFRAHLVAAPRQWQADSPPRQLIHSGLQITRFSDINAHAKTFKAEFDLWFRYRDQFDPRAVVFPNAVTPISLDHPIQSAEVAGWQYVLFTVQGEFRYQVEPYNLIHGVYDFALRFYHAKADDQQLSFATDNWGMGLANNPAWLAQLQRQQVFGKAWEVLEATVIPLNITRSSLGDPLIAVQNRQHPGLSASFRVQQGDYALSRQIRAWLPTALDIPALLGVLLLFGLSWLLHRDHPLLARLLRLSIGTFLFYLFEQFLLHGLALSLELLPLQWLLTALQICWWLIPAWWITRLLPLLVWQPIERRTQYAVPDIAKTFVTLTVYALSWLAVAYYVFEQSLTSIWAASGVLTVVLGFALRNLILDAFTGLTLNAERPFQLEQWIQLSNSSGEQVLGRVEEMNWRTTRLWTREGNLVIVPNSTFGDAIVVNFSQPQGYTRLYVFIHLDFSVPLARALRILDGAAQAALTIDQGLQAEPPPRVLVDDADEQGVLYRLILSHDVSKSSVIIARSRILSTVMAHMYQAGLKPGLPKRDLHLSKRVPEMDWLKGQQRDKLLRLNRLFADLTDAECQALAAKLHVSLFAKDAVVIRQGDAGESMFGLGEGLLGVYVSPQGNGEEIKVADMEPGSFFGEMSLLTGEPRSATIKAESAAVIYELRRDDIKEILVKRPEIVDSISRVIAQRKLDTSRALDEAASLSEREQAIDGAAAVLIKRVCIVFGIELGRECKK